MTVSGRTLLKALWFLALTATTLAVSLWVMWLALRTWLKLPLDLSLALVLITGLVSTVAAIYGIGTYWPSSLDPSDPGAGAAALNASLILLGFAGTVVLPLGLAMYCLRLGHSTLTLILVVAAVGWLVAGSRMILPRVIAADSKMLPGRSGTTRFAQHFRACVLLLPLLLGVSLALTFLIIYSDYELVVLFTVMSLVYGVLAWSRLHMS